MQSLVVVGFIFEEILNINVKCVKVTAWSAKYRSRSPAQWYLPSQYIKKKHYTRFGG